uniref:Uncharacterized protein n=1 Tax=Rhizophora mucronata TaxID=61149 RepID=A0A2P2L8C0_RHIMU
MNYQSTGRKKMTCPDGSRENLKKNHFLDADV